MEAYSSSVAMPPVRVGGQVGHILTLTHDGFVGGCVGFVALTEPVARHLGGCAGDRFGLGHRRFVGGCAGFVDLTAYDTVCGVGLSDRAPSETGVEWGDEEPEAA